MAGLRSRLSWISTPGSIARDADCSLHLERPPVCGMSDFLKQNGCGVLHPKVSTDDIDRARMSLSQFGGPYAVKAALLTIFRHRQYKVVLIAASTCSVFALGDCPSPRTG